MKEESTYTKNKTIAKYIGKEYQRAKQRMDILEFSNSVERNAEVYHRDMTFVHTIDRLLFDCSRTTRLIVQHEFLANDEAEWFLDYYSRSTYYRMKRKAVEEFVNCLNI